MDLKGNFYSLMCVSSLYQHARSLSKVEKDLKGHGDNFFPGVFLLPFANITKSIKYFVLQEMCCAIFRLKTLYLALTDPVAVQTEKWNKFML